MNTYVMKSPIGKILLLSDGEYLKGLWFCEDKPVDFLNALGYVDLIISKDAIIDQAMRQLEEYFEGTRMDFTVPLEYMTTKFRNTAWESLRKIPYGQTRSYKAQAEMIGNPKASRAVGQANHYNPISIMIPCHRVVSSDGKLTGYASGVEKKKWLLEHEAKHAF